MDGLAFILEMPIYTCVLQGRNKDRCYKGSKAIFLSRHLSADRSPRIHNMARMMVAVIVCLLVLALDVTAGILGLQAQAAQNKSKTVTILFIQCEKPVHKAYQLGLAAAVFLVAAHAVASFLAGCACICSQLEFIRASINRKLAATTIILSWIALIVGFSLLLAGAMNNSKSKTSCGFVHGHTLALGGIMCFVHAGITIAYYVTATAAAHELP